MTTPNVRILIVEDEALVARDLATIVKGLGYGVAGSVGNGEDACTETVRLRPDLILMDIRLPGAMDGIDAAAWIREQTGIPVVYLTAHADEHTLERAKATAPLGYLVKPFAERELQTTLEMALYRAGLERKIQDQRRWFEATLNCIGDAVIAADVQSRITFMNPVAEHLTGWTRERATDRPLVDVFRTVDPASREPMAASEARALRDEAALTEEPEDALLLAADGAERPITSTVTPINDARSKLLGMVIVFRDISARRQTEQRVLERQKMEALGKLASNIARDFGNILSVVAGLASAMNEYLPPDSRAHADTRRILDATEHAGTLTKRILSVARASDAEGNLTVHPVAVREAVADAVGLVRESFGKRNIAISIHAPQTSPVVMTDRGHFLDLLMDLFLNAADAMPEGGKLIVDVRTQTVLKPERRLKPHARPGRYVVLRIRDTGVGMSRETLDHIFEPFFTTKAADAHVGLGLSVVHGAIQRYGGWIKVASLLGQGTTFSIFLPEAPEGQRKEAAGAARPGGATILVVDDSAAVLEEMREALKRAGYKVYTASKGAEAAGIYSKRHEEIDLAIIDVIMPEKDGRAVLDGIIEVNPTANVIMTCGFSRDYVRSQMPRGGWKYLQKPFDQEQLVGAVRRAFEQKTS